MLKIKLLRVGKTHQPSYRVVVVEAKSKMGGKYLVSLGFYNPLTTPATVKIDKKAYQDWLAKGAQPTIRVKKLFSSLK
jgi:small subunit ribosomal protein S16